MIPLRELRLENWVIAIGRAHIIKSLPYDYREYVQLLRLDGLHVTVNGPGKLSPILLTPKILARCGVRQKAMNSFEVIDTGVDLECSYELTSLHRLQNLHFAVTGEELTINKDK